MAAWGYEFYLLVVKVSLILSALEDKIRIPARPCYILYEFHSAWYLVIAQGRLQCFQKYHFP